MLTHGAGGDADTVDLLAAGDAALALGVAVALVTQPFRVAGRGAPSAPAKQDDAWLAIVPRLRRRRGLAGVPLILGGRSNGARVACRTAGPAAPPACWPWPSRCIRPGKPEKSRLAELDARAGARARRAGREGHFRDAAAGRQPRTSSCSIRDGHGLNRDPEAIGRGRRPAS